MHLCVFITNILLWIKYRDIAPEAVEDATIMNLIQKSAGNHSAITAAIENMWHGKLMKQYRDVCYAVTNRLKGIT